MHRDGGTEIALLTGSTPDSTPANTGAVKAATPRLSGLHGLRGVAVLLVVLFHLFGAGRVSGGIDVFLAVSGFLFTGLIARRVLAGHGRFDAAAYVARLIRRLIPPLVPVLLFVLIGTVTWLPSESRVQTWREVAAVLMYRENFELIDSQLGYDAAGVATSPVQHFWSLSVQGQFYLVWPVVILAAYWLARRLRLTPLRVMVIAVALTTALSFLYAIRLHASDPQVAYLHSGARLWQLTLPGLLALALSLGAGTRPPSLRGLSATHRVVIGWTGLALIVSCGFVLDGARLFPGPWALWPVAGLCLFLLAGDTRSRGSADHLLSTSPAGWLADRSYALYLWHWPLLIFALHVSGRPPGDVALSAGVLIASLIAADLTYRHVEIPAMDASRWPPVRRTAAAGVAALLTTGAALIGLAVVEDARQDRALDRAREQDHANYPGAAALNPTYRSVLTAPPLVPAELAAWDKPQHDAQGCWQPATDSAEFAEAIVCPEPDGHVVEDPVATIILTGGSHGAMWEPTWRVLAKEYRWRVLVMVKAGCQLTDNIGQHPLETDFPTTASCQQWNRNALRAIDDIRPDAVFTIATSTAGEDEREKAPAGFRGVWQQLDEMGIDVIGMRDIYRMKERVPACVEAHLDDPSVCDTPAVAGPSPMTSDMVPSNVSLVDLTHRICTPTHCPAVIGNIIAYFDHSHLSASFAETLAPALEDELRRVHPDLFRAVDDT